MQAQADAGGQYTLEAVVGLTGLLREMAEDEHSRGCVLANLMVDSGLETPVLETTLRQVHLRWIRASWPVS
ncbi:MAG: hypothetical protein R3E95_18885 [Thiolinea sp.]